MVSHPITSLQHPLVKKLVKIRKDRSARAQEKSVLIVGQVIIQEVAPVCRIKILISTKPLPIKADSKELASVEVLQKIIGHKTDDLVAAEVVMPPSGNLQNCKLILLLDEVSDPGNVGTIFRAALAMGWDGVYVISGSADPYNDKALRASRAAPLLLPWKEGSWNEAEILFKDRQVIYADTQGTPLSKMRFSSPLLLILGHETRGPSKKARALGEPITIPMKGKMESLNVASAASILLYNIQEVIP
jgi:TrmH family RNA methyltransferase